MESLGRTYCFWDGSASKTFSSAYAVVTKLDAPLYEGDNIKVEFMNTDPGEGKRTGRDYLVQYLDPNTGSLEYVDHFSGKEQWATPYTIPSKTSPLNGGQPKEIPVGVTFSIVVGDSSSGHSANSFMGNQMVYIVNFTTQARSTTVGGKTLDALVTDAIGSATAPALTYNGTQQSPFRALGTYFSISGTQSATNAGTYSVTLTPKMQYKWADGTYGTKVISWEQG